MPGSIILGGKLDGQADLSAKRKQRILNGWTPRDELLTKLTSGTSGISHDSGRTAIGKDWGLPVQWALTAPAGRTANGDVNTAWIKFPFVGDAVALGLYVRFGTAQPDPNGICVKIDRRMYSLPWVRQVNSDGNPQTNSNYALLIDDDLPKAYDGRSHYLEVNLTGDQDSTGDSRTMIVTGIFGDHVTGGYGPERRSGIFLDAFDVPTSFASFPSTQNGLPTDVPVRTYRSLHYSNATGAAARLTINFQGGNGSKQVKTFDLAAAGSAGDSITWDFGDDVTLPWGGTRFQHKSSVAGVVCMPYSRG